MGPPEEGGEPVGHRRFAAIEMDRRYEGSWDLLKREENPLDTGGSLP